MKDWLTPSPLMPVDDLPEPAEQQVAPRPKMPPMLQHPAMGDAELEARHGVPVLKVDSDLGDKRAAAIAVTR